MLSQIIPPIQNLKVVIKVNVFLSYSIKFSFEQLFAINTDSFQHVCLFMCHTWQKYVFFKFCLTYNTYFLKNSSSSCRRHKSCGGEVLIFQHSKEDSPWHGLILQLTWSWCVTGAQVVRCHVNTLRHYCHHIMETSSSRRNLTVREILHFHSILKTLKFFCVSH